MGFGGSGLFLVVEGPEGAGKSTLVRSLAARLHAEGHPVVTVREPGGTPVAEAARKVVLKFPHAMTPAAELFLFLTARTDLVQRVVRPALEAGDVVIADRYNLSTMAYQVAGGGLPHDAVEHAIRLATGGLAPDVTLVLDVPVEVGRERCTSRPVCSKTCSRTWPTTTSIRSTSGDSISWPSTACWTSCTTRTRCS